MTLENIERFANPGGIGAGQIGSPIASAATIAPTHKMHHVTGTATIKTITPPHPDFAGPIVLLADGIWTWDATGNIAYDYSDRVVVVGTSYYFYYDRSLNKWFPPGLVSAPAPS